jgi:hypothetical protein
VYVLSFTLSIYVINPLLDIITNTLPNTRLIRCIHHALHNLPKPCPNKTQRPRITHQPPPLTRDHRTTRRRRGRTRYRDAEPSAVGWYRWRRRERSWVLENNGKRRSDVVRGRRTRRRRRGGRRTSDASESKSTKRPHDNGIPIRLRHHLTNTPRPLLPPLPLSASPSTANLDLLLSLDLALNLIHLSRSSLKRVESFSGYPGHYGTRVRDTVEEVFIALLLTLGERHVVRGFDE